MATFLSNRDGGKTNEEGHYRFQTKSFTGNVNNGLKVIQNNPLSMSVLVEKGDARIPYQEYGYTWWNDGNLSVSLNTADPSNPRDDVIVAYVDRGVTSSSSVTNNPGIVKIKSVAGSPSASPTPPNNTVIQTSVGAGNPFMILAQVRVGAGVSTISNGNITDKRTFASPVIADGAVTADKINFSTMRYAYIFNPNTFNVSQSSWTTLTSITTANFNVGDVLRIDYSALTGGGEILTGRSIRLHDGTKTIATSTLTVAWGNSVSGVTIYTVVNKNTTLTLSANKDNSTSLDALDAQIIATVIK